jgi:putative component of membrane protein insertase Oxa1/YidC/SpoIIIJ protein YidD
LKLPARRDMCRMDESAYCQKLVRPRCTGDKYKCLLSKFERPAECRNTKSCSQFASNVQTYFASPAQATHLWI